MLFIVPHERWVLGVTAILLTALIAISLGLHFRACTQYTDARRHVWYTPNPAILASVTAGRLAGVRRSAPFLLEEIPRLVGKQYPPGWLEEAEFMQHTHFAVTYQYPITPFTQGDDDGIIRARVLWHTWLTGLYAVDYVPTALWYPGGILKDAIDKLEYRPRPKQ